MILDDFRLNGKVAIVTGGGRGIGATIAEAFGEIGASVVCAARTRSQVDDVAGRIRAQGQEAFAVDCDITSSEGVARLIGETVARYGKIDVLINNAGGGGLAGGHGPTAAITEEQMISAFRLNFLAAVSVSRAAIPHMKEAPGTIVNISSGFARVANIGSLLYGCAKAALEQATRMMAMEFAPGVRINAIRVGAVQSENMKANLLAVYPGIGEKLAAWTPVGRLGVTRDIALATIYLASPASGYVTGKILDVEGGMVVERSVMEIIARSERLQRAVMPTA
ncbi:MAG: SDR family oxidoreductase [Candidatus Binatia bacterium]